jgi:hypothetical protein
VGLVVDDPGPCSASEVEVALVESGGLRVVLVSDAGGPGTLTAEEVESVLSSLRPGD